MVETHNCDCVTCGQESQGVRGEVLVVVCVAATGVWDQRGGSYMTQSRGTGMGYTADRSPSSFSTVSHSLGWSSDGRGGR